MKTQMDTTVYKIDFAFAMATLISNVLNFSLFPSFMAILILWSMIGSCLLLYQYVKTKHLALHFDFVFHMILLLLSIFKIFTFFIS